MFFFCFCFCFIGAGELCVAMLVVGAGKTGSQEGCAEKGVTMEGIWSFGTDQRHWRAVVSFFFFCGGEGGGD